MQRLAWLKLSALVASAAALSACGGGGGGGGGNNNPPPPTTYTVSGTVTGLTSGSVVLRLNGTNDVTVSAAGSFNFTTQLTTGTNYTVSVATQPATQICGPGVTNGTGTIASANVTNVTIACATYSVGGTLTGLTGAGLVLQLNYGNDLSVAAPAGGNGTFAFPALANAPVLYTIHIKTQPTGQTCTIVGSSGVVTASGPNVATAAVACIDNVTDPLSGTYATQSIGGQPVVGFRPFLSFSADGTYIFGLHEDDAACGTTGHGSIQYGVYRYNHTTHVLEIRNAVINTTNNGCGLDIPSTGLLFGNADGSLTFTDGTDSSVLAPVTSTAGTLIGSWGDNQGFMVFDTNGKTFVALTRAIAQNGATSPGIEDGCYSTTGTTASGTFTADFTSACSVSSTQSGADTSGPVGASPALNAKAVTFSVAGDALTWTLNGGYAFPFMFNARLLPTAVPVATFTIGGTISGLTGSGLNLRLNGQTDAAYNVSPPANATSFQFTAQVPAGAPYAVTPIAQPGNPTQFCFTNATGAGTVLAANVSVGVTCQTTTSYTVGGTVSGLTGTGLKLRASYYDPTSSSVVWMDVNVVANGTFTFPAVVPANTVAVLGVVTQPSGQTCTVVKGLPFSFGPPISITGVTCAANPTSALTGTYSALINGQRDYFNFNASGTLTTVLVSNDPDCGSRNGNGVEYGMFSWNSSTGAITLQSPAPVIDTNDGCGFWEPGTTPATPAFFFTRVNNTLELRETAGGPILGTGQAVESTAGSLVGGWAPEAENGDLLVFQSDGTFAWVDVQQPNLLGPPATYGQERGCYTASGGLLTLTVDTACRPDNVAAYDFNGEGGLFRAAVKTLSGIPFSLTDANTLAAFGRVFKRTVPN